MRPLLCAICLGCLVPSTLADDADKARAILDRAIQAVGGPIRLAKEKCTTFKMKGTFHGLGRSIPYVGQWAAQVPERAWQKIESPLQGQTVTMVQVIDGKKGWRRVNDDVLDMTPDELKAGQESLYVDWVATLLPLKDPSFKLSLVEEEKVGELDCVRIRVQREGRRDVLLSFDKKHHFLRKEETRVRDSGGNEVKQETFHEEYLERDGIPRATKLRIVRDGGEYLNGTILDQRFPDRLDDQLFRK